MCFEGQSIRSNGRTHLKVRCQCEDHEEHKRLAKKFGMTGLNKKQRRAKALKELMRLEVDIAILEAQVE